jgi:hypothetical protein
MKLSSLVFAAAVLAPAAALAQPMTAQPRAVGYAPANPQPTTASGFHDRGGRLTLGFSLGLGSLKIGDESVQCASCDYDPVAGEFDFHIGGMVNERLAILFEVQGNAQTVAENQFGATSLVQASAMVAAQYWVTPQLWIKGGIGGANLGFSYDDGSSAGSENEKIAEGGAAMGAIGYELLSAPKFSIDAQLRMIVGTYDEGQDVSAGSIGVGFNWF